MIMYPAAASPLVSSHEAARAKAASRRSLALSDRSTSPGRQGTTSGAPEAAAAATALHRSALSLDACAWDRRASPRWSCARSSLTAAPRESARTNV